MFRTLIRIGTCYIFGILFVMAAHAANIQPDPTCESKLLPGDQLIAKLTSRKKTITIIVGETPAIENLVNFSLAQLPAEFNRRTTFEFSDHLIEHAVQKEDEPLKENYAALKLPIEERAGKTQITVGLLFRDWLNQHFEEPTIKHLLISANQLSTRQQKELLEIYNSLPDDSDFHLMLFSTHANNMISGFREKTEVIHADPTALPQLTERRGTYLRQIADDIIKPKQKIWIARIETPNIAKGHNLAIDVITLAQTLSRQEIEFFLMQTESFRREQQELRPAFEEMQGHVGSAQAGVAEADLSTLDVWNDIVSSGPNKNSVRLIVIPFANLNNSERRAMHKWVDALSNSKDAHLYRILILDHPQK